VELALPDRPAWTEVVGVLAVCVALFALITKLDRAAADRAGERARKAQVAQAPDRAAARGHAVKVGPTQPRTESIGGRGPIAIPLGGAWSAGTTTSVAHDVPTRVAPVPTPGLRRIVGPAAVTERAADPPAATAGATPAATAARGTTPRAPAPARATPAPAPAPAAAVSADAGRSRSASVAIFVLAALGAVMAAAGAVLLGRGR
jgi:hypothetical protein